MGINGEKFLFLEHEFYPLFLCPHGKTQANKLHLHTKGMI